MTAAVQVVGKAKLGQDKPAADVRGAVAALDRDPTHANPALAAAMRLEGRHVVAGIESEYDDAWRAE